MSEVELLSNLRCDILEADRRPGDALEADAVQREARQLAHLNLTVIWKFRGVSEVHFGALKINKTLSTTLCTALH